MFINIDASTRRRMATKNLSVGATDAKDEDEDARW